MARRTLVLLTDDLTGEPLDRGDAVTVTLGVDGEVYTLDVSEASADTLRTALSRYVANARRLTPSGRPLVRVTDQVDPRAVRAWARANGIELPARGRVPGRVIEQFRAAGN